MTDSRSESRVPAGRERARFVMVGFGLSEPGTMGGNTKIALEIARNLRASHEVHVVVPANKAETVVGTLGNLPGLTLHVVPAFEGSDLRHPVASVRQFTAALRGVFDELQVGPSDLVYSCSDIHVDTLPCFRLQRRLGYRWIAVQFLFVPFLFENLAKGYGFPALKYVLVWLYSNGLFRLARRRAWAFVITNHSDLVHFPVSFRPRVFPYYGGVNVEQIPSAPAAKTRDVVFCSRLCAQKGIRGFLDVWKRVLDRLPAARFTLIGTGAPDFERSLRAKAEALGVADSIDWMGYVNNEAKYEIYRSARVMVHPTVFDNNGMVAAEALCSGLPVVMYDLPALRSVYTTGCVKVPFGDQSAFADRVVKLLTEPDYAASVAPTAAQVAALRAHWNWSQRAAQFAAWLQTLS